MLYIKDKIKIEKIKSISTRENLNISNGLLQLLRLFNVDKLSIKNKMIKYKGYAVSDIITVLILFPFMAIRTVHSFSMSRYKQLIDAQKDTFFRIKNNPSYNWRNLLYLFAKRFKNMTDPALRDETNTESIKCLIVDDTVIHKTGKAIEFIGKVFDHVIHHHVLGFKLLLLSYWDGDSLIPLDFSLHSEKGKNKKYPFGLLKRQLKRRFTKKRSNHAAGYKRAQEVLVNKISNTISMIKRAVKHGFIPDYILSDTWFSCEKLIQTTRQLKSGAIHFLGMVKMDKRLYQYQTQQLNAKILKKQLKSKMKRAKKLNAYYIEVIVNYSDIGPVKLFFTRFSKRSKWRLLLSTNVNLTFHEAVKIYNNRWTIEVLFKECKQLLNLGNCQSNDFDAQIADATISLLVYLMLSFHKKINCHMTLGALFAQCREQFIEATVAEKLWRLFLTIQFTIAETFAIDHTKLMRVIFQTPEFRNMLKSLSEIFLEDDFLIEFNKAA